MFSRCAIASSSQRIGRRYGFSNAVARSVWPVARAASRWGDMVTLPDCPGLLVMWRLRPGGRTLSGTIEVRDIRLTPVPGVPGYAALTSSASVSDDGATLYVIVFNKHHESAIRAEITVEDFAVASARAWTVTGPSLDSFNLKDEQVRETVAGAEVPLASPATLTHTFPPHSMTALELTGR